MDLLQCRRSQQDLAELRNQLTLHEFWELVKNVDISLLVSTRRSAIRSAGLEDANRAVVYLIHMDLANDGENVV